MAVLGSLGDHLNNYLMYFMEERLIECHGFDVMVGWVQFSG